MKALADRLARGGNQGLGCANAIALEALHKPNLVADLVAALTDEREVVTRRSANALRKIQKTHPELLAPHTKKFLRAATQCDTLLTRWNLTIILGGLPLKGRDKALAIDLMFEALESDSGFLRTFAITALAQYAQHDASLRIRVRTIIHRALEDSSAAMRARARKLTVNF